MILISAKHHHFNNVTVSMLALAFSSRRTPVMIYDVGWWFPLPPASAFVCPRSQVKVKGSSSLLLLLPQSLGTVPLHLIDILKPFFNSSLWPTGQIKLHNIMMHLHILKMSVMLLLLLLIVITANAITHCSCVVYFPMLVVCKCES